MARSTTCYFGSGEGRRLVHIKEALALRSPKLPFRGECPECGETVRPHQAAKSGMSAHFEHLRRNKNCSLSDPAR
jgi:ribosomal protein L32